MKDWGRYGDERKKISGRWKNQCEMKVKFVSGNFTFGYDDDEEEQVGVTTRMMRDYDS